MEIFRIVSMAILFPILTVAAPQPTLRIDKAAYDLGSGVLQIAFTFVNAGDSVAYLDCQMPPRASLAGGTLTLVFDRKAAGSEGAWAGGPAPTDSAPAAAVDPDAYPPQRIAERQTFQGQRRFDRVLGDASARPKFTSLRLVMAVYPERAEGEGTPYLVERGIRVAAPPHAVARQGKPPVPPKPVRIFKTEP